MRGKGWRERRFISFLLLLVVIAVSVGLFLLAQRYPDQVRALANLGYAGVFIVSLISSATIILPVPGVLVAFPLALTLNPLLVALAASTGGIIGEVTGYVAGYGGHGVMDHGRMYRRAEDWFRRWGIWALLFFATVPIVPFDVAGLMAGAMRYPLWKFLLVGWVGKSIKFIGIVMAMVWGFETLLRFFD
ncbi:MAG: DedA family protein [Chloroflexi bacterium]|nr:DedA family protein [Chloroflexota bacterium]